jgi:hypothetical protein
MHSAIRDAIKSGERKREKDSQRNVADQALRFEGAGEEEGRVVNEKNGTIATRRIFDPIRDI